MLSVLSGGRDMVISSRTFLKYLITEAYSTTLLKMMISLSSLVNFITFLCFIFLHSTYHLLILYVIDLIIYCLSPSIKIQALWEWEISSLWFTDASYKSPENRRHWINICWISKWSWCFSFSGLFGKHIMVYNVDLTSPQRLWQGGMVQG